MRDHCLRDQSQRDHCQHHRDVPTTGQVSGLEEYVDLSTLFEGPLFRIRHWRCLHDGQVLREERASEWDVEETVLTLLGEVLSDLGAQDQAREGETGGVATRRDQVRVAEAVRAFLCEHFRQSPHLDDVARAVHVSPYHLCRIFKRVSGETIHQYRNRLRLLEALEPAADPSTDLTALALDLGFSSHSHFTSSFRRLFGLTPTQLRVQAVY